MYDARSTSETMISYLFLIEYNTRTGGLMSGWPSDLPSINLARDRVETSAYKEKEKRCDQN